MAVSKRYSLAFSLLTFALLVLVSLFGVCGCSLQGEGKKTASDYPITYEENYDKDKVIYVIGHKNPDSDAVCAAVAYAAFLTELGFPAQAVTAGEIDAESSYALSKFGVDKPIIMTEAGSNQFCIVDHSTYDQSITGMDKAIKLAIVDHHNLGDMTTSEPLLYLAEPIGCTSTIVYEQYVQYEIKISKEIAGLMLTAILSDTLGLKSATTTQRDNDAVEALASIAGIKDYTAYTKEILDAGNTYDSMTTEEVFASDLKKYSAYDRAFAVGVVQSLDASQLARIEKDLDEYVSGRLDSLEVDMCFMMMVNIATMETKLLCYGDGALAVAKRAFGVESDEIILANTLSRKKQVVPDLMNALS